MQSLPFKFENFTEISLTPHGCVVMGFGIVIELDLALLKFQYSVLNLLVCKVIKAFLPVFVKP